MPNYYTADYLYNDFKALASMRKSNPAYANDSTYWDDGHCNCIFYQYGIFRVL